MAKKKKLKGEKEYTELVNLFIDLAKVAEKEGVTLGREEELIGTGYDDMGLYDIRIIFRVGVSYSTLVSPNGKYLISSSTEGAWGDNHDYFSDWVEDEEDLAKVLLKGKVKVIDEIFEICDECRQLKEISKETAEMVIREVIKLAEMYPECVSYFDLNYKV